MAKGSETDADALRRLQERLDRAAATAERLFADAGVAAAGEPPPIPPAGWQRRAPRDGGDPPPTRGLGAGEIELLLGILTGLRDRIPPDLQQRLADALREVLLALRALIDWYLERTERAAGEPGPVEDIPIL